MVEQNLQLRYPSIIKQVLAKIGIREISPSDICKRDQLPLLYAQDPFLRGDFTAIGFGDDGYCQSWRNNPGWWKQFLNPHQSFRSRLLDLY